MNIFRFFVSNLPLETTEPDLKKIFKKYGAVKNIELKTKSNATYRKIVAFVTLQIESKDVQKCIYNLQCCTLYGQQLLVTLAKESFLERLKKEREEAQSLKCDNYKTSNTLLISKQGIQSNIVSQNKRKTFDIYEDLKVDDVESELMIIKKRAANSVYNGKIVILNQAEKKPLHIIEKQKAKKQHFLNMKSSTAERKRKESVNKMKQDYMQKKTAIQQALKSLDHNVNSKKTTFDDEGYETNSHIQINSINCVAEKPQLFSDNDNNETSTKTEELKWQSLLTDQRSAKLAKLQSAQTLDARFRMNEKFLESEDDDSGNEVNETGDENSTSNTDERKWQMNILEHLVGSSNLREHKDMVQRATKYKQMFRYDPNNKEYQKNVDQEAKQKNEAYKSKSLEEQSVKATQEDNAHKASKEHFYMVTDTLQQSLKKPSKAFSLLSTFKNSQYMKERHEQLHKLRNERILLYSNKFEKCLTRNPFNYDSSCTDSEREDEISGGPRSLPNKNDIQDNKNCEHNNQKITNKLEISKEYFFITAKDKRLKEGANFFQFDKKLENYDEVRQRLKQIIKTKISKTKKSLINAGFKAKKRYNNAILTKLRSS